MRPLAADARQRFAGEAYGVYQMGEDQARSSCVIGTSVDILIPKRSWS